MNKPKETSNTVVVNYSIFRPAGNDTAFVYGLNYSKSQKKQINDAIMERHSNVEQVGFIDLNGKPELQMAGGEFCGNATRSAATIFLNNRPGSLKMLVNSSDLINAGVDENGKAWCEIPLYRGNDEVIVEKEPGIFIVKMNGMVSVVIQDDVAKKFLDNKENLKLIGMDFIHKYHLEDSEAVGIMFCEKVNDLLKINPVVWVNAIDTLFYETACGSGTTATCMVEAFKKNKSVEIDVLQPSGLIITAKIDFDGKIVKQATILGDVETDGKTYSLEVLLREGEKKMERAIKVITPDRIHDFIRAYEIFRTAPYYEDWTDEMILNEYNELIQYNHIHGYYIGKNCAGLITFRPMLMKDHHPIHYDHCEKVAYLSDLTVFEEYRNNGIGTELMKYALNTLKEEGYERVYMKTLEVGKSMSYGLAVRLGFQLIEGTTSVDTMKRLKEGRSESDLKIYLDKKL